MKKRVATEIDVEPIIIKADEVEKKLCLTLTTNS
jgi:hypothetical protein